MAFTAEQIAAAVLYIKGGSMHYDSVTSHVRDVGFSGLGRHGDTPSQTLKTVLLKSPLFDGGDGSGFYSLKDQNAVEGKSYLLAVALHFAKKGLRVSDLESQLHEAKHERQLFLHQRNELLDRERQLGITAAS
jgi:hypothetical protein